MANKPEGRPAFVPIDTNESALEFISGSIQVTGSVIIGEQPVLITGSVVLGEEPIEITGSATINSIASPVTVEQGAAGTQSEGWFARITDGVQVLGTGSSAPLYITGSVLSYIEATGSRGSVKIEDGAGTGAFATIIDDTGDSTQKRLQVEAEFKEGSEISITANTSPTDLFVQKLLNGGSPDMAVNPGGTPDVYTVIADPTRNIQITELRLVFTAKNILFDGGTFGKGGGALSTGVELTATINDGTLVTLGILTVNENFLELASNTGLNALVAQGGINDVLAASFIFGGTTLLVSGTSDNVSVTINDNLAGGVRDIAFFEASLFGRFVD